MNMKDWSYSLLDGDWEKFISELYESAVERKLLAYSELEVTIATVIL